MQVGLSDYRTSDVGECPRMSANVLGLSNLEPSKPSVLSKGFEAGYQPQWSATRFLCFLRRSIICWEGEYG